MNRLLCCKKYYLLGLGLWFLVIAAFATDVDDLFKITLPAKTQKPSEKEQLIQKGLKLVLTRATGQPKVLDGHQSLQKAVDNADEYVQSFYYTQQTSKNDKDWPLMLHVQYQSQPIDALLKKHHLPVWGQDRPLVLIWAVDQTQQNPSIISDEEEGSVGQALVDQAKSLGLPVVLPLMDMVDFSHLQPKQLLNNRYQAIKQASQRYYPNAIAVLSFNNQNGQINSNWHLYFDGQQFNWQRQDPNKQIMAQSGIEQLTSTLSEHSAVINYDDKPSELILQLKGVNNLQQVAKAHDALKTIAGVQSVHMKQLKSDRVIYNIIIDSNLDSFIQKLGFNDRLSYERTIHDDDRTIVQASFL